MCAAVVPPPGLAVASNNIRPAVITSALSLSFLLSSQTVRRKTLVKRPQMAMAARVGGLAWRAFNSIKSQVNFSTTIRAAPDQPAPQLRGRERFPAQDFQAVIASNPGKGQSVSPYREKKKHSPFCEPLNYMTAMLFNISIPTIFFKYISNVIKMLDIYVFESIIHIYIYIYTSRRLLTLYRQNTAAPP